MRWIPLSEPEISGNEWRYIKDCLDSGWVSSTGTYTTRFEESVMRYTGASHAIAVSNGTAALHLSYLALGIGPGDEVLVPALTFVAPVNAVRYCGATPVFLDCDPETLGIDASKAELYIDRHYRKSPKGLKNKRSGSILKAVVLVHVFGNPVDMDPWLSLSRRLQLPLIEDATESLGSTYKNRQTGVMGRIGIFSFNGNKILTTGGGGIVVTEDIAIARRIRHLSTQAKSDPLVYDHDEIGYNYRLSALAGAMGVAQMERLDEFIRIKRSNAETYRKALLDSAAEFLWEQAGVRSNFWLYTLRVPRKLKTPLLHHLLAHGIQARPVWKLIPTLPMYRTCPMDSSVCAEKVHQTCLNIPSSVNLRQNDIRCVAKTIKDFLRKTL